MVNTFETIRTLYPTTEVHTLCSIDIDESKGDEILRSSKTIGHHFRVTDADIANVCSQKETVERNRLLSITRTPETISCSKTKVILSLDTTRQQKLLYGF